MTITITQTCDSCGAARDIPLESLHEGRPLAQPAEAKGWRQVRENKHLCSKCIDTVIK